MSKRDTAAYMATRMINCCRQEKLTRRDKKERSGDQELKGSKLSKTLSTRVTEGERAHKLIGEEVGVDALDGTTDHLPLLMPGERSGPD